MKIFCNDNLESFFQADASGVRRLVQLYNRLERSEEIEYLTPSDSSDFYIVGTQVDVASRLIGAVVNNSDTGSVFFALGLTTESNVCLKTFSDSFNTLRAQHQTHRDLFSDIDSTFLNAKSERTCLSAAQMLCINLPGRKLLLQVNGLAAKIEAAALNEKLPASPWGFTDMSAAQILFLNPDGHELLLQDKSLAAKIEPAALNEKLPATPWGFADMSAGQVLFLYGDGLKLLLQDNGLAAKIEPAALNEKLTASAWGFADMSAAQILFLAPDGPELLLQDNGLAAKIEAAALNEKFPASARGFADMSATQVLFLCQDGLELLLQDNGLAAKI